MIGRILVSLVVMSAPRLVQAANLGPFAEFAPVGTGIISLAYLLGGGGVAFLAVRSISAYRARDMEGMGPVMGYIGATVISAILLGTLVPGLIAPILAQGATPPIETLGGGLQ